MNGLHRGHETSLNGLTLSGAVEVSTGMCMPCRIPLGTNCLEKFKECMRASPMEFFSIIGPPSSGRSTAVKQLQDFCEVLGSRVCWLVVDIRAALTTLSQVQVTQKQEVLRCLISALCARFQEVSKDPYPESTKHVDDNDQWDALDVILEEIGKKKLTGYERKIVVFENCDVTSVLIPELLRYLHEFQAKTRNRKLFHIGVVCTSISSLRWSHDGFVSPFNTAKETFVGNLSRQSFSDFIACVSANNRVEFTENAQKLLYDTTSGFLLLAQNILHLCLVEEKVITEAHVANAIARCWLSTGFALNMQVFTALDVSTKRVLEDLVCGRTVINAAADKALQWLYYGGFVSIKNGSATIRSMYHAWLALRAIYAPVRIWQSELCDLLWQMPMVELFVRINVRNDKSREAVASEYYSGWYGVLVNEFRRVIDGGNVLQDAEVVRSICELGEMIRGADV